jgi:hypothetical protein
MKKIYNELHIFATEADKGMAWTHRDWYYKVCLPGGKRVGKLYKSRECASRFAGQTAKRVVHWYPI